MKYHSVKKNIKHSIATATRGVSKSLAVHQLIEGRIKEINQRNDPVFNAVDNIFHEPAKIHVAFCRCNPTGNYYFCRH